MSIDDKNNRSKMLVKGSNKDAPHSSGDVLGGGDIDDKLKPDIPSDIWFVFADSYLNIVIDSSNKHLEEKILSNNKPSFIAIIYNLKHAFEIVYKALIKEMNDNNLTQEDRTHYLETLNNKFENRLSEIFNKEIPENINSSISQFKEVVKKYYCLELLFDNVKIYDTENTLFKYPEGIEDRSDSKSKKQVGDYVVIKYDDLLKEKVDIKFIKKIIKDAVYIKGFVKKIRDEIKKSNEIKNNRSLLNKNNYEK